MPTIFAVYNSMLPSDSFSLPCAMRDLGVLPNHYNSGLLSSATVIDVVALAAPAVAPDTDAPTRAHLATGGRGAVPTVDGSARLQTC